MFAASATGWPQAVERLRQAGISVSLFLDPDPRQIEEAARLAGRRRRTAHRPIRLGRGGRRRKRNWKTSKRIGALVRQAGLALHAGHGLTYRNVRPVAAIEGMHELNIGHSIVARAIMVGFEEAVREMKRLVARRDRVLQYSVAKSCALTDTLKLNPTTEY